MRLVPDEHVHPVLVGHRGANLFLHIWDLFHLHLVKFLVCHLQLHEGAGGVPLNASVRAIAKPDVRLPIDYDHPQV